MNNYSITGKTRNQAKLPFKLPKKTIAGTNSVPQDLDDGGILHYLTRPLGSPGALEGVTNKILQPESDHALYITANDAIQYRRHRSFEIFINSRKPNILHD